jgi:hypothetical protein
MKKLTPIFLSSILLVSATAAYAEDPQELVPGGVSVTPTRYELSLKAVDFKTVDNTFVSYSDEDAPFDMASANAGSNIGNYGSGAAVQAGTYDGMRFTMARSMTVVASGTDDLGNPCHTEAGLGTTTINADIGGEERTLTVNLGSTDNSAATADLIEIPNDDAIDEELEGDDGMETLPDGSIRGALDFSNGSITIPAGATNPDMKITFNVTNAVTLKGIDANECAIIPNAPAMTVEKVNS